MSGRSFAGQRSKTRTVIARCSYTLNICFSYASYGPKGQDSLAQGSLEHWLRRPIGPAIARINAELFLQGGLGFRVPVFHGRLTAELDAAFFVDSDAFYPNQVANLHHIFNAFDTKIC